MIYPNKQAAQEGLNQIEKELRDFLKERNAWIFSDYEYSGIGISVSYINEKGYEESYDRTLDL
jgi:hypothetical protein